MTNLGKPSFKALFLLSWPTVITFTGLAIRALCDIWLAGRLGRDQLAALAPAQLILLLILSFGYGSLYLVNTFASQAIGSKNLDDSEAGQYAWQGIWYSVGYGLLALLAWPLAPFLFRFFGHVESVSVEETLYFRAASFSIGWQMIAFGLTNYLFGLSRPLVPMFFTLVSVLVHGLSGYALVFGKWGAPALGISGIAWALVASSATYAICLLAWLTLDPYCVRCGSRLFHFDQPKLAALLKTGLPLGARDLLDNVVWGIVVIWLIGQFGPVPMAAATVILTINDILMLPCDGAGSAMLTLMGRSLGRRDFAGAESWRKRAMASVMIYAIVAGGVVFFLREPIFTHLIGNAEVADLTIRLAGFIPVLLLLYACYGIFDHALCAAGDNLVPTLLNLLLTLIFLGGGGWVFLAWFSDTGSFGVWSLMVLNLSVITLAFWLRWRSGKWRTTNLLDDLFVN